MAIPIASGSNDEIFLQVVGESGPEDISELDHVEIILVDRKGTKKMMSSTNPGGQNERVTITNGANGELKVELASSTISDTLGDYRLYLKLFTTSSKWQRCPSFGDVLLRPQ